MIRHDGGALTWRMLNRLVCGLALGVAACRSHATVRLPDTGLAHAPDGRVAFVRATPNHLVSTSIGDEQATELWIANADGTQPRRILVGKSADSVEHAIAGMSSPQFSLDGGSIYFLSRAWVTSDAIHAIDIATGRQWFVAPGNSLAIIPRGPLAGCLLVDQHRYWPDEGGSYDWTWLLTSAGQAITLAASDSDGAERRLATWMAGSIPEGAFDGARVALPNVHCR